MQRFVTILQDKKLWATLVGLLVSVGILEMSDAQQADLIASILAAGSAIAYIVTTVNEQASRIQAEATQRALPANGLPADGDDYAYHGPLIPPSFYGPVAFRALEERVTILEKRVEEMQGD